MKKIITIALVCFTMTTYAQTKEGKVVYERTMQLTNMRFGGNMPAEIQAQMPKSRTDQYELLFTSKHSLYQFLPNAADEGGGGFSGGGMVVQMRGGGNDVTYIDFEKGSRVDQREIMDKSFIVTDTVTKLLWKLSEETKTILNFTASKATATSISQRPRMTMENGEMKREIISDTLKVVAWYTTDIPVPTGPSYTGQLPGLILETDLNNGQNVIKAIEFSPKVSANKIKEPSNGKKVTAAEFAVERDKIMEEMRKNMPNGNVIRMQ